MSYRKAASSFPACLSSRPFQASLTLIAFILLHCVAFASLSSISSSATQGYPDNNGKAVGGEDAQLLEKLSQPVKRAAQQYNFGLGKRGDESATEDLNGLSEQQKEELKGEIKALLERINNLKRSKPQRFSFGIGKRAGEPQRFSFGLGKRAEENVYASDDSADVDLNAEKRKAERYQFGIGKRDWFLGKKESNFDEFMKRRYSFGIGKRSV